MSFLALFSLLIAFFCVILGNLIFHLEPKNAKNRFFLIICLLIGFGAFTEFGARQADSFSEALFWLKLSTFSLITIAVIFHFSLVFTEPKNLLSQKRTYLFIYLPAIILVALDMGSGLFSGKPIQKSWGWTYDIIPQNFYLFRLPVSLAFIIGILAIFLLWRYYARISNLHQKKQISYILAGFSIPIVLGYGSEIAAHLTNSRPPEIITLAFATGMILVGYALWQEKLSFLTPAGLADDIVNHNSNALILVSPEGKISLANPSALKILGYQADELINQSINLVLEKSDVLNLYKTPQVNSSWYTSFLNKNGERIHIALSVSQVWKQRQIQGMLLIARDLTPQKEIEKKLILRLEQEKLLHKVSANSIYLNNFNDFLQQTLKLLGRHLGVSRIAVYEYYQEQNAYNNIFEWKTEETPSLMEQFQDVPGNIIPNTIAKMQKNEIVAYEDLEQIPEGQGKDFAIRNDYRAFLFVPLFINNQLFGFMGFAKRFEKRKWQPDELDTIRSVSYIITGVMERNKANQALHNAYQNLEKKINERTAELTETNRRMKAEISERIETQKENEQLVNSLTFLSQTAIGFIELGYENDIYDFTAKKSRELLGEGAVIVTSIDENNASGVIQGFAGLENQLGWLEPILNCSLMGLTVKTFEPMITKLLQGKLFSAGNQLKFIIRDTFPDWVYDLIEKNSKLQDIYLMGLTRQGKILGTAAIVLFEGQKLNNSEIIETFLNQASIVLQRQKAEEILRTSEEKYRNLAENLQTGIFLINPEMKILAANRKTRELFPMVQFEKNPFCYEVLPHEKKSKACAFCPAKQVFRKGISCTKIQRITSNGESLFLKLTAVPLKNADNQIVAATVMMQDMTLEFKAEEKINNYQKQLRAMTMELSVIEEKERKKIATELHDYIGQNLAFAKIKLGELKESRDAAPIKKSLNNIYSLIEESIVSSRNLTFELSLPILYELGFESALEWLSESLKKQHGLMVNISLPSREKITIKDEEILILTFKAVRELLTNTIKHSNSKNADLIVQKKGEYLNITITDQGAGFEPEKIFSNHEKLSGFGLFRLKENLYYLGGEMKINSGPGQGTKITMIIPMERRLKQ